MAGSPQTSGLSCSPRTNESSSSSEDNSPQSGITVFSPPDQPPVLLSQQLAKVDDSANKDPFISLKGQQKLCPTASSFQPIRLKPETVPVVAHGSGGPFSSPSAQNKQRPPMDTRTSPIRSRTEPEFEPQQGTFSTSTMVTRCLKVSSAVPALRVDDLEKIIKTVQQRLEHGGIHRTAIVGNEVFVRFTRLSDSEMFFSLIRGENQFCLVGFISPTTFIQAVIPGHGPVSAHEGQVRMTCRLPISPAYNRVSVENSLHRLLMIEGDIVAYQRQMATEANIFAIILEFDDVECAPKAVGRLNGECARGVTIACALHQPDLPRPQPVPAGSIPSTPVRNNSSVNDIVNMMSVLSPPYGPMLSPTGRSIMHPGVMSPTMPNILSRASQTPPGPFESHNRQVDMYTQDWRSGASNSSPASQNLSSPQSRTQSRRQFTPRAKTYSPSTHHNTVDINRIRNGSDVRTTIMLRNIPNKVTQVMLKQIVDETSFGLYDFMYLRIDFANNCNVGYAFINFEDPYNIIDFVNARAGKKWNHFNSDKVAEVSYATIQGKDCLVQKFRNSSVMLEHPAFRPKIFYTGGHPCAGLEEDFPSPDNPSKMRRSVENAEHVGLFAPRSGQHFHEDQRRHRSRYDRGTRFADIEEGKFNYEDNADQNFDEDSQCKYPQHTYSNVA